MGLNSFWSSGECGRAVYELQCLVFVAGFTNVCSYFWALSWLPVAFFADFLGVANQPEDSLCASKSMMQVKSVWIFLVVHVLKIW